MKYYTEAGNRDSNKNQVRAIKDRIVFWREMLLLCVGIPNADQCSERKNFRGWYAAVGANFTNGWNYGVNRIFPRGMCNCFSGRLSVFKGLTNKNIFQHKASVALETSGYKASPD